MSPVSWIRGSWIIIFFLIPDCLGANYYCSSLGANIPPYDSWEKAATDIHTILDSPYIKDGDTIWLDNQEWVLGEGLLIKNNISIRSRDLDPDRCILSIATRDRVISMARSCTRLSIEGITVKDGYASFGGALITSASLKSLEIKKCKFINNYASYMGGALYLRGDEASVRITGTEFENNFAAQYGGGFQAANGTMVFLNDCLIANNLAGILGGGARSEGNITVRNCIFRRNSVAQAGNRNGGGLHIQGGSLDVEATLFDGNDAWHGAGLYYSAFASGNVKRCVFFDNHALKDGGGLYIGQHTAVRVDACLFVSNRADRRGGGVYYLQNGTSAEIYNSTFYQNHASSGGSGLYGSYVNPGHLEIHNCIFWDWIGEGISEIKFDPYVSFTLEYNDIKGGYPGEGNLDLNPMFVDPEGGNFELQPGSPCIDAGTSEGASGSDFAGNCRYDDPGTLNTGGGAYDYYDIGAYEYFPACKGDFDRDGDVDGQDLLSFQQFFGRTNCNGCIADLDGDGDIDGSDLSSFAEEYGRMDCPICPE